MFRCKRIFRPSFDPPQSFQEEKFAPMGDDTTDETPNLIRRSPARATCYDATTLIYS